MTNVSKPCRRCKTMFELTPYQIKYWSYVCPPCQRETAKAWRDKRKADGSNLKSLKSRKMPSGYWAEYEKRDTPAKKKRTRALTKAAIKRGEIKKQNCEKCGDSNSEVHHPDYDNHLLVMWLCKKHHHDEHNKLKTKQVHG